MNFYHQHIDLVVLNYSTDNINYMFDIIQKNCKSGTVILNICWESATGDSWLEPFNLLITRIKNLNLRIILFLNTCYKSYETKLNPQIDEICFVDYFLYRIYCRLHLNHLCEYSTSWNSSSKKFLFLPGKPHRVHRTRLLYKLSLANLLSCANWSFSMPADHRAASRVFVPELTDLEFDNFVNLHQHTLDYPQLKNISQYSGIPFNVKIYNNSLFQVVTETCFDRVSPLPFLTEKTWLPIINHLPFIITGDLGTLKYLEQLGFKTFTQYLSIPGYNNLDSLTDIDQLELLITDTEWKDFYNGIKSSDWPDIQTLEQLNRYPILFQQEILSHYRLSIKCINELRLDAVVQNTKKLLDNIHGFEDQIRNDVEHNYCRFLELGQENCFRIEQVIKKQQLDCDIYDAVPLEIPIHKFQLIEETAIIDSLSDL